MDVDRPIWRERLDQAWAKAPIAWLAGVRRVGKTVLAKQLPEATFFNCDLPAVQARFADPDAALRSVTTKRVVLDEVHRLADPSQVLKIAADEHPHLRVLATGSSTLEATRKFRDSLTGRKRVIHMVPVLDEELEAFGVDDLDARLLRGGLPRHLLASDRDPEAYAEWLDSYFARDVQELFRVEKREGFLRLLRLLLRQSGGLVDISRLARDTELSRPTVMSYLDVFAVTQAITKLRPFSGKRRGELVSQPKIYGFDTGFVCFERGHEALHDSDRGNLLEHLTLETLQTLPNTGELRFWRDKELREIDFVLDRGKKGVVAIECKWSHASLDTRSIAAFRSLYAKGENLALCANVRTPFEKRVGDFVFHVMSPRHLRAHWGER